MDDSNTRSMVPSAVDAPPPDGASVVCPLPDGATTALRSWLQSQRRAYARGAEVRAAEIRRAMRPTCDEAHRRGVRVEQLIVLLKELWAAVPPGASIHSHPQAEREILDGIVRVCIEEFYAPRQAGADARQSVARAPSGATSPHGGSSSV